MYMLIVLILNQQPLTYGPYPTLAGCQATAERYKQLHNNKDAEYRCSALNTEPAKK